MTDRMNEKNDSLKICNLSQELKVPLYQFSRFALNFENFFECKDAIVYFIAVWTPQYEHVNQIKVGWPAAK